LRGCSAGTTEEKQVPLNEVFSKRFNELEAAGSRIPYQSGSMGPHARSADWKGWATSAESLVRAVFGDASPQNKNFSKAAAGCRGYKGDVEGLIGLFRSAKEDFEGGYVFNVEMQVSGEVFGDFVGLARHALHDGHKEVAAVLACAALEDALKRFAQSKGIDVTDKTMQDVVNALKAGRHVAGAQKTLLDTMTKLRNWAMHAEWSRFSEPDVNSVVGFVEQFLLTHFS
jgi:hypothetical protein